MAAPLRKLALAFVCLATPTVSWAETQPLTSADQKAVQSFFGWDESEPNFLEVGGWRQPDESGDGPIQVFGYLSVLRSEKLLDRLCIVENRWGQGLVVEDEVEWVSELFQIHYNVWEPATPICAVRDRSGMPESIALRGEFDGSTLLRIIDGSRALLERGLTFIDERDRPEYLDDRLLELQIDGFEYRALFGSNRCKGVSIAFSESLSGFKVHSAGEWVC